MRAQSNFRAVRQTPNIMPKQSDEPKLSYLKSNILGFGFDSPDRWQPVEENVQGGDLDETEQKLSSWPL
jgi:hypothetical protein